MHTYEKLLKSQAPCAQLYVNLRSTTEVQTMLLVQYAYPFDPNGTATTNKVVGERHTITPFNGPDFRFLVPRAAPFFKSSMQLMHVASGTPLLEGIHWAAGHKFDRASNTAPFLAVYGSVLLLDNAIDGVIELTEYQTLGGEFTINETLALQLLANAQLDPRLAKWDNVLNTPTTYDPLLHRHHASDSTGYEEFSATLNRLADAIIAGLGQSSVDYVARSHIANTNNPHNTTLAQLPDAAHLLGLTPQVVQQLITIINNGGTGGSGAGGNGTWVRQAAPQLVAKTKIIPGNEVNSVTYQLPAEPEDLDWVEWAASPVSFATNPMTIIPTTKPIMGESTPLLVNTKGECGMLIYFASIQSWFVYKTGVGAGGSSGLPLSARDGGGLVGVTQNMDVVRNAEHIFLTPADVSMSVAPVGTLAKFSISGDVDPTSTGYRLVPLPNEIIQGKDGTATAFAAIQRVVPDSVTFKRIVNGWKQL